MSAPAIRVEGLWKEYVTGAREQARTTFREALIENITAPLRRLVGAGREASENRFWALQDVSFDIQPGEVVGIIGRNGAGKSTLLKILSRITAPTKGRIEISGRIASLLEVGTGFHPELTGRENIRLNGAILGMSGAEIARKFDEIVAFAAVEQFLDTPVKRYSSGMYVRLAFAVAAHLEPEILVVDEVLAVGDSEFQKKCLGRMGEVAQGGRTVLFVSHNMTAVQTLCPTSVLLTNGALEMVGPTASIIGTYSGKLAGSRATASELVNLKRRGVGNIRFASFEVLDKHGAVVSSAHTGRCVQFRLTFGGSKQGRWPARIGISFSTELEVPLFICANEASHEGALLVGVSDQIICRVGSFPLSGGKYKVTLFLESNGIVEDWIDDGVVLDVEDASFFGTSRNLPIGWEGATVLVPNEWWRVSKAEVDVRSEAEDVITNEAKGCLACDL